MQAALKKGVRFSARPLALAPFDFNPTAQRGVIQRGKARPLQSQENRERFRSQVQPCPYAGTSKVSAVRNS
jgi:hypothetical protein